MLVMEGNPHAYITMFDRLVDDYEVLLDGELNTASNVGIAY